MQRETSVSGALRLLRGGRAWTKTRAAEVLNLGSRFRVAALERGARPRPYEELVILAEFAAFAVEELTN